MSFSTASSEPEGMPEAVSEPQPVAEVFTEGETALWLTAYCVWIGLIIVLNAITILALVRSSGILRKVSNMFLLSLVMARTTVAILVMPARITGLFSSLSIGPYLCKLCHFAGQGSAGASVFSTCGVAVAKLIEIKYPRKELTRRQGGWGIVTVWLAGYLYGIRAYFLNNLVLVETLNGPFWACTADNNKQTLNQIFIFVDLVLLFLLPVLLIAVCYSQVLKILHNSLRKHILMDSVVEKTESKIKIKEAFSLSSGGQSQRQTTKSIQMLIAIMAVFCICYASVYVWKMYVFFSGVNIFKGNFLHIEQSVYLVSYANPWINVFIYLYFRDDIRSHFCPVFKKRTTPIVTE